MAARTAGASATLPTPGRATGLLAAGAITALAVVAAIASYLPVVRDDSLPFGQGDPSRLATWMVAIELGAALSVVAGAWAIRGQHPQVAGGLAFAAVGVLLPFWATWSWLPSAARAAVLAAFPLAAAGVATVALRWAVLPSVTARRSLRTAYLLVAAAVLIHLLGYNPFADPGCVGACDDVRPALDGLMTSRSAVTYSCALAVVALAVASAAVARATRPKAPRPMVVAVLACNAALATASILRWATWGDVSPPAWHLIVEPVAVALVASTVAAVGLRTARTRVDVRRLVARLDRADLRLDPVGGAIRGVEFALPDALGWVDSSGRAVGDPAGRDTVVLSDADGPVLRLILPERADPGSLLAGLTPASRLALTNARLTAVTRARQADVQESQRRIVATADAERRRIERDLHDGAQQRLVGAALHLRAAVGRVDEESAQGLMRAEAQVRAALAHLRLLARGIFPTVLTDEGLAAAIEELASTSAIPITFEVQARGPVETDFAMAAYALITATLDRVEAPAKETRARVSVLVGEAMSVRVEIERANMADAPDLTDVADRIGAAGGRLSLSMEEHDTFVAEAVIPCGS
jgi:signal transduction histidine kinase